MKFFSYGAFLIVMSFVASMSAHPAAPELGMLSNLAPEAAADLGKAVTKLTWQKLGAAAGAGVLTGSAIAVPIIASRDNVGTEAAEAAGKALLKEGANGAEFVSKSARNTVARQINGGWKKPILLGSGAGVATGAAAAAIIQRDAEAHQAEMYRRDTAVKQLVNLGKAMGVNMRRPGVWKPLLAGGVGAGVVAIPVAAAVSSSRQKTMEMAGMGSSGVNYPINQNMY